MGKPTGNAAQLLFNRRKGANENTQRAMLSFFEKRKMAYQALPKKPKRTKFPENSYYSKISKNIKKDHTAAVIALLRDYQADSEMESKAICLQIFQTHLPEYHLALLDNPHLSALLRTNALTALLKKTSIRLALHPKNIPVPEALSQINLTIFKNVSHRRCLGTRTFIDYLRHDPNLRDHMLRSPDVLNDLSAFDRARFEQCYLIDNVAEIEIQESSSRCFLPSFSSTVSDAKNDSKIPAKLNMPENSSPLFKIVN